MASTPNILIVVDCIKVTPSATPSSQENYDKPGQPKISLLGIYSDWKRARDDTVRKLYASYNTTLDKGNDGRCPQGKFRESDPNKEAFLFKGYTEQDEEFHAHGCAFQLTEQGMWNYYVGWDGHVG